MLTFNNDAPFRSCITKINNAFIGNAEDLDIVILMYNLLEHSDNYSVTSGSFWNYYRDEVNGDANENNTGSNYSINNIKTARSETFEYKTIGSTPADSSWLDTEVVVPLKYLSNFRRSLDLPLINCAIELEELQVEATTTTSATFHINNANFYVPVVTLSINNNIKFLENEKQGFRRTVSSNKSNFVPTFVSFHPKMVMMILQETLNNNVIGRNQRF